MLKLRIGYLNNNNRVYFVLKYSDMVDSLRNKGNIYKAANFYTFDILSIAYPMIHINDNEIYIPGDVKNRDNDVSFLVINLSRTLANPQEISDKIKTLVERIVYSVNEYNNSLTNKELKEDEKILIDYIQPAEIINTEKEILEKAYLEENINNTLSPYYGHNIDINIDWLL